MKAIAISLGSLVAAAVILATIGLHAGPNEEGPRPRPPSDSLRQHLPAETATVLPVVTYYYVVSSEEQAEAVRRENSGAGEYYGSGRPEKPAVIIVIDSPAKEHEFRSALPRDTSTYRVTDLRR